jgi:phosphoribosylamine-glycine ligase
LEINTRPGNPEFLTILDGLDHSVLLENLFNAASRQPFIDQEPSYHQASVAICVHNKNYNRFRKWNSVGPKISLTEDIDLVRSSMILGYFNYYGAIVARGSDRRAAAAKIYQRLDDSFIGDYTYRTDIGELE